MNVVLWVVQLALAFLSFAGGAYKIFMFEELAKMPAIGALPRGGWASLGVFEMLCGVLLVVPAALVGDLLLLLAMTMWLQEATTVVDRHRIVMRGRSGLFKKWNLDRPRSEVTDVVIERRYVLRGNYRDLVWVHFDDGERVLAMAPAFYRVPRLEERADELRRFLGL